jgi:hypothetical protein
VKITPEKLRKIIQEELHDLKKEQQEVQSSTAQVGSVANQLLGDINALANQIASQQKSQAKPDGQQIGEAGAVLAFSVALAIPKLLSLAGTFSKKILKKEEAAKWFEESAHKVHHAYIAAIMKVLSLVPQYKKAKPEIQKKIAEMVFMAIVGVMLGFSVSAFAEQMATMSNLPLGVVEGILTAIKRNEIQAYLITQVTALLKSGT